jgi:tetrahydromethanopterin S-methyltransferase subunit G
MEAMMERRGWSDDRIDALDHKVDEGFRHVDQRFDQVDKRFEQVDKRFEQVDKRFDQVDKRFDRIEGELYDLRREMNARFDSLQRTLLLFGATMFAALAGAFATQLALILTQG